MVKPALQLRRMARVAGFLGVTSALLPAYALRDQLAADAERDALRDRWTRRWADGLMRVFGIELVVLGDAGHATQGPGARRGRLVVANHRGVVDVMILLRSFGGFMVSRADLSGWPLVGAAARRTGTIFVDRQSKSSGAHTIRAIREQLTVGHTVNVFPEGTTFAGDEVRPFHAGAFLAAANQDVDVVPVGIAYSRNSQAAFVEETFPQHLARMSVADRSTVVMAVGPPISGKTERKAASLAERTRDAVREQVARARAHADDLDAG